MFKRLLFIGVLCISMVAMLVTDAKANYWYKSCLGFGCGSGPYYIQHNVVGGAGREIEPGDALIETDLQVLTGVLILWSSHRKHPELQKVVLGGLGFSMPVGLTTDLGGLVPDDNGNLIIDQLLPFSVDQCTLEIEDPPGSRNWVYAIPDCGGRAEDPNWNTSRPYEDWSYCFYHRYPLWCAFVEFWGLYSSVKDAKDKWGIEPPYNPPMNFSEYLGEYVKNNSLPKEYRIELAQIMVTFDGDRAKYNYVEALYRTCVDTRVEEWPDPVEYVERDEGEPWACDDAYRVGVDGTLKRPQPGPVRNDFDYEGDPLTVAEVNGIEANVGVEIITDQGGTLILYENGRLRYTPPDGGFTGDDSFTYMVNDINGYESNVATVTITVY